MFYSRVAPPDDCPSVCERLPDNFADDLATKPRIQAEFQRFWGTVMGMTPDQPLEAWRRYGDFYLYLTQKVDAEVTRVLDALDQSGVADHTLTVFCSDHGEMAGAHRPAGQRAVRLPRERPGAAGVPLARTSRAGARTAALTHNVDLFPTLLDLAGAGAAPAHLPGRSIASIVRGDHTGAVNDHVLLTWGMTARRANRGRAGTPVVPGEVHGLFDGRWKLARYFEDGVADEELELYDLHDDPLELRNLAADPGYATVRREMADRLRTAEDSQMAPIDAAAILR